MRRAHDIGLKAQDQHVVGVDRAGLVQPAPVLREQFFRQRREQVERGQERRFLLDDAVNGEIAVGEFQTDGGSFVVYALGGTEIWIDGRLSIRSLKASRLGKALRQPQSA